VCPGAPSVALTKLGLPRPENGPLFAKSVVQITQSHYDEFVDYRSSCYANANFSLPSGPPARSPHFAEFPILLGSNQSVRASVVRIRDEHGKDQASQISYP
jgi:hypothetical protein